MGIIWNICAEKLQTHNMMVREQVYLQERPLPQSSPYTAGVAPGTFGAADMETWLTLGLQQVNSALYL